MNSLTKSDLQRQAEIRLYESLDCQDLTKRELYVARLLAYSFTVKEIASALNIAHGTVTKHLQNIYTKLGAHKETDVCRWFIFNEYGIADNPFKKVVAHSFLVLALFMTLSCGNTLRTFRALPLRPVAARAVRMVRSTRTYRNVFELAFG